MPATPYPLRVLNLATQGANIAGTMLIVGLVIMICTDVLGRNLFGTPLPGVPEMVSLSIVAIVFLQVPQALKAGRLTQSDAVITTLRARSPRSANLLEAAFEVLGFLVIATIIYAHWPILMKSITRSEFVGAVGNFTMPTWPAKLMILIGAVLLALQFIARIALRLSKGAPE
ncbi:TRAP-type mannitol/chloroaromatic compound transport system permease small subunit [Hoeflea halophila]|uniref:TRAP transporter small permease protein n=1 Tax=Hoeflea halophila TaxID=714899 RepID=A0A286IEB3_9HYPH|nr:TRAP transporter small permease [Hoeflea halophila]SOE18412.1 TRAP-type mannitol/chloroaromatic compound transport system permease small subunit [Hoeflea halophila]